VRPCLVGVAMPAARLRTDASLKQSLLSGRRDSLFPTRLFVYWLSAEESGIDVKSVSDCGGAGQLFLSGTQEGFLHWYGWYGRLLPFFLHPLPLSFPLPYSPFPSPFLTSRHPTRLSIPYPSHSLSFSFLPSSSLSHILSPSLPFP